MINFSVIFGSKSIFCLQFYLNAKYSTLSWERTLTSTTTTTWTAGSSPQPSSTSQTTSGPSRIRYSERKPSHKYKLNIASSGPIIRYSKIKPLTIIITQLSNVFHLIKGRNVIFWSLLAEINLLGMLSEWKGINRSCPRRCLPFCLHWIPCWYNANSFVETSSLNGRKIF